MFVIDAPLGLIFEEPTIKGLVKAVDKIKNEDLGIAYKPTSPESGTGAALAVPGQVAQDKKAPALEYGKDLDALVGQLKESYASPAESQTPATVFLTGATGFLGAFVLADLLARTEKVSKVITLVRGKSREDALARLKSGSTDRGVWDDKWVQDGRLEVVVGDLSLDKFGLGNDWERIASEADVVLHNGALVSLGSFLWKHGV